MHILMKATIETADEMFRPLWHLVGNTPMLALQYIYKGIPGEIYVKCEHYNLTGSVKDRMALYILQQAYGQGKIQPGDAIIEVTSGNTGISFASIGRVLGHPVKIIMPDWLSQERMHILRSLGADLVLMSKQQGGFVGSLEFSERLAYAGGSFLPRQFANEYNAEAHERTTAVEIWDQLASVDKMPDAFVAGVGTGGTVMGVSAFMRRMNPLVSIHPLEPRESPTLSAGKKVGSHRIQGISDEFIPPIVQLNELDKVVQASDGDAIRMAQKLSQQVGLAVGISSGANVIGAIQLASELGPGSTVVTLLPDSNKKYLSTDLVKEEPAREGFYSSDTEFTGYRPIARLKEPVFARL